MGPERNLVSPTPPATVEYHANSREFDDVVRPGFASAEQTMKRLMVVSVGIATLLSLSACTNPYDPGQRAAGGGLLGAGAGAAIGAAAGGGRGAALGALVGGAAGAAGGYATTPPPPPPPRAYYPPPPPPPGY
jgi:hypothetical protein